MSTNSQAIARKVVVVARGLQSKVHADALNILTRNEQILHMRTALRMKEWQIGQQVGLTESAVSRILHKMLRERLEAAKPAKDQLLQEVITRHEQRYRRLYAISEGKVSSKRWVKQRTDGGDTVSVQVEVPPTVTEMIAALSAMQANDDAFCRRLGLDAPVKVEHSFRQEPLTQDELIRVREQATPEELVAIASGDQSVMIAVITRAGIPMTTSE